MNVNIVEGRRRHRADGGGDEEPSSLFLGKAQWRGMVFALRNDFARNYE